MRPDIALVSPYPAPGRTHGGTSGVASYTAHLAHALADQGASVLVVAPDEPQAQSTHSDGEVRVERSGPRGSGALTRAIRMAAYRHPRVIHLQHEMFLFGGVASIAMMPVAARLMRNHRRGAVTTVHQVVEDVSPDFMKMHRLPGPVTAARVAMNIYQSVVASAGVVVVHEAGFVRQFPNAVVIPHGVEEGTSPARAHARYRLGLADEPRLVVLCFGFVAPYKGLEFALAAASDVPEVRLVVAGGDHPRHGARYTDTLKSRWGDVALFTGWVPDDDVATWHAAADLALFCYPTPHSSSGAVATALAHGTPFLVSDALAHCMGLPRELAVPLDRGVLAARLRRLADDRDSLTGLRRAASHVVAGRSWSEVARRHLELYEEIGSGAGWRPSVPPRDVGRDQGQLEAV